MLLRAEAHAEPLRERRLLWNLLALVRRCEGRPQQELLDAVLAGTGAVRPALPGQRRRAVAR